MSQAPIPGWYADPQGLPAYRWWDGQTWTAHTTDFQPPVAAAPAVSAGVGGAPGFAPQPGVVPQQGFVAQPGLMAQQGFVPQRVPLSYGAPAGSTQLRGAPKVSNWHRNQYAFITLGIVALYVLIALKGHVYVLGVLPVMMSFRSQQRREPLAVLAMAAAALAVVVAVIGLTHH